MADEELVYVVDTVGTTPSMYHTYQDCTGIKQAVRGADPRPKSDTDDLEECGECQQRRERTTDDGADEEEDALVAACPECSSSQIHVHQPGALSSHGRRDGQYRCDDCHARFDDPIERPNEGRPQAPGTGSSLAAKLARMDPDDVQGGAD